MKHYYLSTSSIRSFQKQRVSLLTLVFLLFPLLGFAQLTREWVNVHQQAASTAAIVVGTDQQPVILSDGVNLVGFEDPTLTKLNQQGEVLWKHQFEEEGFNFGNADNHLAQDAQANNYVMGETVIKYSPDGQLLWEHDLRQYGFAPRMIKASDLGQTYIVGYTDSYVVVLSLSSTGEKEWVQTIPYSATFEVTSNPIIAVGTYVYVGFSGRDQSASFVTLLKLDGSSGNTLTKKEIRDNSVHQHYTLEDLRWLRSDYLYMFVNSSPGTHIHILKININDEIDWETEYRTEDRNSYVDATFDNAGNILLLTDAQFSGNGPSSGPVIAKISNAGRIIWHRPFEYATDKSPSVAGLVLNPDGRAVVAGTTTDLNGKKSVAIQHYSATGNLIGSVHYVTSDTSNDYALDLASETDNSLYFVGSTYPKANSTDESQLVVAKLSASGCTTPDLIVSGGAINCVTNTAQLTAASSVSGLAYSWTGPNGFASNVQNPTVTEPGEYTVTVKTGVDCIESATVSVLPANTGACYTIDFEKESEGLLSATQTNAGTVSIFGWNRWSNDYAPENHAAIFDTGMPSGDDGDLYTQDWVKVLIINETLLGEPNDNRTGGMLDLDFSAFGPVTLESMKVLDIDEYEDDSWVYLYDADGNEIFKTQLQPLGNNSKQTIDLGNTQNVIKMRVVLAGTVSDVGSGAIDDIKFCVEAAPCQEPTAENALAAYAAPTLFSDKTTITFEATEAAPCTVTLHDLRGNLISELANGTTIVGEAKEVEVDGTKLPNGMYIARITSGSQSKSVKLILNR